MFEGVVAGDGVGVDGEDEVPVGAGQFLQDAGLGVALAAVVLPVPHDLRVVEGLHRVVGGSVVHDVDLVDGVGLAQQRVEGGAQQFGFLFVRGQDGDDAAGGDAT